MLRSERVKQAADLARDWVKSGIYEWGLAIFLAAKKHEVETCKVSAELRRRYRQVTISRENEKQLSLQLSENTTNLE
jgi:hypothetical protein